MRSITRSVVAGEARLDPAVELVPLPGRGDLLDPVRVRVEDVEGVRVPERLEELAHRLADGLEREAVAVPGLLGGEVVPAECVRAVGVEHLPGDDDVALRLGHLLALGIEDQPEAEAGLVRRAAEQQHRDRQQRVEPAARLVERLADVVGREVLLEPVLVLERRVPLGERHAARSPTTRRSGRARGASRPRTARSAGRPRRRRGDGRRRAGCRRARASPRASPRRRRGRRRRRSARSAAGCPSSARATAPSRRCSRATCRSGRA